MTAIIFNGLPLPHYISSGVSLSQPGRKHPERWAVGEFDLLVVKQGVLFIGEDDRHYRITEGHALILRPDLHHYPTAGCSERTESFWLHFHTLGTWWMDTETPPLEDKMTKADHPTTPWGKFRIPDIQLAIPQFVRLVQVSKGYELLYQLIALEKESHLDGIRFRQQMLFQELLLLLASSLIKVPLSPGAEVADQAASYLRGQYKEQVSASELGMILNFHPVYIARCMHKRFGCSPMVYLQRYRLEQARLLLLQTDLPIHFIAEEVGFQQAAYFTSCFRRWGGLTPREYRKLFAAKE
ncbi:MAG: AraC family transcriptional regulator [Gorillibacterium sp.]|nr:AraC family transcriptional regulator [Gorillibacterium sp.]